MRKRLLNEIYIYPTVITKELHERNKVRRKTDLNFKREDKKIIKQITELRKELSLNRELKWNQILFAQVKMIQATAREHAAATFPLYVGKNEHLKYWTQFKRLFNIFQDRKKKIIGVPHILQTVDGKRRRYFFEELAYKGTAGEAKKHQDKLNKGGLEKSKDLELIEKDTKLKLQHERELKEILKRAKRR